jgi:hypothetical protein
MAQLRQTPGSALPTQLHEPFTGCLQLGGVDLLENGQTEACTIGFSIRNPLASNSMQRSLHQTLSESAMAMAHVDWDMLVNHRGQQLTVPQKKWRNSQI